MYVFLKVSQSLAVLHPLSNDLYIKIVRIHSTNNWMISGQMCSMRARRVGHRQTLETAVRSIGARHVNWPTRVIAAEWWESNIRHCRR